MTAKKQSLIKKGVILQVSGAESGPRVPQPWAAEALEGGMQIMGSGFTVHPWDGGGFSSRCLYWWSVPGENLLLGA